MIQIRHNVFETNSSSSHTLVICTKKEYKLFEQEKLFYADCESMGYKFYTFNDLIAEMIRLNKIDSDGVEEVTKMHEAGDMEGVESYLRDYEMYSINTYGDNDWGEPYTQEYTTPGGEEIVAFGYYGYNG